MKFDSKAIAATFFERVGSEERGGITNTKFKCQCGVTRTQNLKKGYQNLISHIKDQHSNWEEIMKSKHLEGTSTITQFVNTKASNIFYWLEWVVIGNHPFNFVENPLTRKGTKYDSISVDSLMKYLYLVTAEVEKSVASKIPNSFGIIIDGWSEGTKHFIGVFACYDSEAGTETPLLAIAPPFDEENYDALSHKSFIVDVLQLFGKTLKNVLFLVGDNAPINPAIAHLMDVPFIGCASHRFNLACKKYLEKYEDSLQRIDKLMGLLRNIKKAGKLRKKTKLEPFRRNVTRWSSTYTMLKRFFELREFIEENDDELIALLPSGQELLNLQRILNDLKELDVITKELQKPSINLSTVRTIFDAVINAYPVTKFYLDSEATIVANKTFENAIVKVIDDLEGELSNSEELLLDPFCEIQTIEGSPEKPKGLLQQALQSKKRKLHISKYPDLKYIAPTSNVVERLFSSARLVLTDYRKAMTPYSFECVMFLKFNRKYWDLALVGKLVTKEK